MVQMKQEQIQQRAASDRVEEYEQSFPVKLAKRIGESVVRVLEAIDDNLADCGDDE